MQLFCPRSASCFLDQVKCRQEHNNYANSLDQTSPAVLPLLRGPVASWSPALEAALGSLVAEARVQQAEALWVMAGRCKGTLAKPRVACNNAWSWEATYLQQLLLLSLAGFRLCLLSNDVQHTANYVANGKLCTGGQKRNSPQRVHLALFASDLGHVLHNPSIKGG